MNLWQDLTNNLLSTDTPSVTKLGDFVGVINEHLLAAETLSLLSINNSFAITNNGGSEDHVGPAAWNTFLRHWKAGYKYDLKSSFEWGLGD